MIKNSIVVVGVVIFAAAFAIAATAIVVVVVAPTQAYIVRFHLYKIFFYHSDLR